MNNHKPQSLDFHMHSFALGMHSSYAAKVHSQKKPQEKKALALRLL